MAERQQPIRELLNALEHELRQLDLWDSQPPSKEALASAEPFCVDTLSLSQWLQWLLIPRMHALLDGNHPLPTECSIHVIAEESFRELEQDCSNLLTLIQRFDQALTLG